MKNFTSDATPELTTLAGGTDEPVGTLDLRIATGIAKAAIITIKGVSGVAITDCKLQVRNHEVFGWSDYLTGADWIAASNGAQRNWTSDQSPVDVAPNETGTAQIKTLGYAQLRLLVTGTAATVIEVQMQAVQGE